MPSAFPQGHFIIPGRRREFSLVVQAERGRFEPPRPVAQSNGLANRPLRRAKPNPGKSLRLARVSVVHHLPTDTCQNDPDLAAVAAVWPSLPEAMAGIVAMVRAASPEWLGFLATK